MPLALLTRASIDQEFGSQSPIPTKKPGTRPGSLVGAGAGTLTPGLILGKDAL